MGLLAFLNLMLPGDSQEANDWDDELSDVSEPSEDEFAKEMALLAKGM